jgi:hypothetical protein
MSIGMLVLEAAVLIVIANATAASIRHPPGQRRGGGPFDRRSISVRKTWRE